SQQWDKAVLQRVKPSRILIVDDTPSNRDVLVDFFKQLQFETIEAQNGEEALEYCQNHQPDLILLDICMPGMTGYDVMQALKQLNLQIPIIAVTASAFEVEQDKIREAGAVECIIKPFDMDELLEVVFRYLGQEPVSQPQKMHPEPIPHSLLPAFQETIQSPLKEKIQEAIFLGDGERVKTLLLQLEPTEHSMYLFELADQYQYEILLALLDEI
ncbi:hypothetical protein COW64_03610, partial [bacterium (Candidatus Blackallbacteria) CG18_big_fil_WC_8_21_14_2_50_49_26]